MVHLEERIPVVVVVLLGERRAVAVVAVAPYVGLVVQTAFYFFSFFPPLQECMAKNVQISSGYLVWYV